MPVSPSPLAAPGCLSPSCYSEGWQRFLYCLRPTLYWRPLPRYHGLPHLQRPVPSGHIPPQVKKQFSDMTLSSGSPAVSPQKHTGPSEDQPVGDSQAPWLVAFPPSITHFSHMSSPALCLPLLPVTSVPSSVSPSSPCCLFLSNLGAHMGSPQVLTPVDQRWALPLPFQNVQVRGLSGMSPVPPGKAEPLHPCLRSPANSAACA